MSKAKHTPGPWIHEVGPDAAIGTVYSDDYGAIAQAQPTTQCATNTRAMHDIRNANARLIASAPDLLEALELVMDRLVHRHEVDIAAVTARAAIAKARGEA